MLVKFLGLLLLACVAIVRGDIFGTPEIEFRDGEPIVHGNFEGIWENISFVEALQQLQNSHLDVSLIEKANISSGCNDQLLEIVRNRPSIGIRMLDAASKIPSGVMEVSRLDLGNFDECVLIEHDYSKGKIRGKYCTAGLIVPDLKNVSDKDLMWKLAICIPDQCSASDMRSLFKYPLFTDSVCTTNEPKQWEAGNIITL
ncbi:unnamed protein product [Acanthoscelides obtectus]|uniref:Nose resistant-to-fluoxetine protein N-terminal domain-containing protein n=1 Tax=Acanthoscelides obtectus TaxID=200917 RepID=A0A9P0MKD8_ACAOB|nr:unnamed protein product [Acanthoscelides obtectus]CAK1663257.1 hypothetical protein AOBTE_LOCUS23574 [Acanthoscelides obtectus]